MNNIFGSIMPKKPNKNVFDMSHEVKMTGKMGALYPFYLEEIIPGDTFKVNSEILLRLQPLVNPAMHRVDVYTHFFFVPNRIIWENWQEFITGGDDGLSELEPPQFTINEDNRGAFVSHRLGDYLGIPPLTNAPVSQSTDINALPFRAYHKIFNDYYRDQNLQDEIDIEALDEAIGTQLHHRAWEKDYFTSCLPFAQKGGEVTLPIAGEAPIFTDSTVELSVPFIRDSSGDPIPSATDAPLVSSNGAFNIDESGTKTAAWYDPNGSMFADLTQATAVTIEELRTAVRLQEWLERNARGGSRYIEQIYAHFGVISSDARLQRPEYLGGGKQPVVISEVLSTANVAPNPQGTMTGHGISVGKTNSFKKFFEEHGFVIGLLSVVPRTNYQNGLHKLWNRKSNTEYYWPEFAQLGEQAVQNKEVYFNPSVSAATNPQEETFGYQSRYAEYKYGVSRVAADMRDTLDSYHWGRQFDELPALNEAFIKCVPAMRPFAVTESGSNELIFQIFNQVKAIRPMPYFNVPTI